MDFTAVVDMPSNVPKAAAIMTPYPLRGLAPSAASIIAPMRRAASTAHAGINKTSRCLDPILFTYRPVPGKYHIRC
jgi:hypothetical protein